MSQLFNNKKGDLHMNKEAELADNHELNSTKTSVRGSQSDLSTVNYRRPPRRQLIVMAYYELLYIPRPSRRHNKRHHKLEQQCTGSQGASASQIEASEGLYRGSRLHNDYKQEPSRKQCTVLILYNQQSIKTIDGLDMDKPE